MNPAQGDPAEHQEHRTPMIERQRLPKSRSRSSGVAHGVIPASGPVQEAPRDQAWASLPALSNYQRCCVWDIENTSHYSRDVTLGEDRSRIRTNPGVFARLRSFAFNILKANQTDTLNQDRYRAGLAGITKLLRMLAVPER